MTLFIFALALVIIFAVLLWRFSKNERILEKINRARHQRKERIKRQIFEEVKKRGKLTQKEVKEKFHLSRRTAIRYLDELEKEKKIIAKKEKQQVVYYKPLD